MKSIRFSMSGSFRELDVCRLDGALHIPMAEISRAQRRPPDGSIVGLGHSSIMAPAARWSSASPETPALTTRSISTGASMPGLAMSTRQCRAIDSVRPKRKNATMPLTELKWQKQPASNRAAGPIAVFSNSYARLPEHFFARLSPTPVAKPRLIKFNEALAAELGVIDDAWAGRVGGDICRERPSIGRRTDRDGLCRASVRQFRSTARRRSARSCLARSWTARATGAMSS